jgi:hypothetical protein
MASRPGFCAPNAIGFKNGGSGKLRGLAWLRNYSTFNPLVSPGPVPLLCASFHAMYRVSRLTWLPPCRRLIFRARWSFILLGITQKVIDACPDAEWRCVLPWLISAACAPGKSSFAIFAIWPRDFL